ncbi:MAG: Hint domain-containing protein [Bauldia sp.]|nr:Hint domain-containing protein [Bauldia sp.]
MKRIRIDYSQLLGFAGRSPGDRIDFTADELSGRVGAKVAPPAICFLRGTMIRTPDGDRPIEDLAIGDLVTTLSGDSRPIRWIGRQRFQRAAGRAWVHDVRPVRFARGGSGRNLPMRDLYLSQAHAVYQGARLVPARRLVNGRAITFDDARDLTVLDYFNVELEAHDVIFAEGLAVETFLSRNGNREAFDNFVEFERLYGPETGEPAAFAPRASVTD